VAARNHSIKTLANRPARRRSNGSSSGSPQATPAIRRRVIDVTVACSNEHDVDGLGTTGRPCYDCRMISIHGRKHRVVVTTIAHPRNPFGWVIVDDGDGRELYQSQVSFRTSLLAWDAGHAALRQLITQDRQSPAP
jgi:hypothetical protein